MKEKFTGSWNEEDPFVFTVTRDCLLREACYTQGGRAPVLKSLCLWSIFFLY